MDKNNEPSNFLQIAISYSLTITICLFFTMSYLNSFGIQELPSISDSIIFSIRSLTRMFDKNYSSFQTILIVSFLFLISWTTLNGWSKIFKEYTKNFISKHKVIIFISFIL